MLSILSLEARVEAVRISPPSPAPISGMTEEVLAEENPRPEGLGSNEDVGDYELVLGRTQVAGVLFVAVVVLVVFSAVSYLAGKALASKAAVSAAVSAEPTPSGTAPVAIGAAAVPAPIPVPVEVPEQPLFGTPAPGALFLQLGAVEKGVAVIMVEGLRKRGFLAFLAPGPAENVFRVLVGPIPENGFRETKEKVDQFGLNTFVKKYQP